MLEDEQHTTAAIKDLTDKLLSVTGHSSVNGTMKDQHQKDLEAVEKQTRKGKTPVRRAERSCKSIGGKP